MSTNSITIFVLTFLSGLSVFFIPNIQNRKFRNLLAFSGAYLFSMTVIHILPEMFSESTNPRILGIFLLAGFYLQVLLNYFSKGVEHGHVHVHHNHSNEYAGASVLFFSLWIHSFLEGGLLVHAHIHPSDSHSRNLLFGLSLHKIPEAIALIAVLLLQLRNKILVFLLLIIYAISTPLGLELSAVMSKNIDNSGQIFRYIFAVVAGNFLHISTTIFFEAEQPGHTFKGTKLIITLMGAFLAVLADYFL